MRVAVSSPSQGGPSSSARAGAVAPKGFRGHPVQGCARAGPQDGSGTGGCDLRRLAGQPGVGHRGRMSRTTVRVVCIAAALSGLVAVPDLPDMPGLPGPAAAQQPDVPDLPPAEFRAVDPARVEEALRLDLLARVLAAEIAAAGDPLRPLSPGVRDPRWQAIAARIAPPQRILAGLRAGVAEGLAALHQPAQRAAVAEALSFWETPLGRRVVLLELAAREAMIAPGFEASARADFAGAAARNHPRAGQVQALVAAGDLVEPAVAAALNMAVALLEGVAQAERRPVDPEALLRRVWAQEPAIRADQSGWIEALLHVATGPLSDAEMALLVRAAGQPGHHRLNAVLQQAASGVFAEIARDLGRASARRGQEAPW